MSQPALDARPRPVLFYAMASGAVSAFLGFADIADLVPHRVIQWVALAWTVVGVAWGIYVQSQVTPLSSPQNAAGVNLVPVRPVPPGASTRTFDVRDPL